MLNIKKYSEGFEHVFVSVLIIVIIGALGTFYLVATHAQTVNGPGQISGTDSKCLDNFRSQKVDYNKIDLWTCNGTNAQSWTVESNQTIVNKNGYCLDVYHRQTAQNTKVDLFPCNGTVAQVWQVNKTAKTLMNPHSGLCLSDENGVTSNGNQIVIASCAATAADEWTLPSAPASTPPPSTGSSEDIISTLYAYPTEPSWAQVEKAKGTVKYAIVNICAPDGTGSGCGKPADEINQAWVPTVNTLKNDGITPLYYISTNYGDEPLATVESELSNAVRWYKVASPMFDTMSTNNICDNGNAEMTCTQYYDTLYKYAVNAGATAVVFNPGTTTPSSFMFGTKEILQVFEGTAQDFESTTFPSWMKSWSASQFSATLSTGKASNVGFDINDAVKDHIGNFYEDDEAEPPNYSTLPSFWTTEVTDVANVK